MNSRPGTNVSARQDRDLSRRSVRAARRRGPCAVRRPWPAAGGGGRAPPPPPPPPTRRRRRRGHAAHVLPGASGRAAFAADQGHGRGSGSRSCCASGFRHPVMGNRQRARGRRAEKNRDKPPQLVIYRARWKFQSSCGSRCRWWPRCSWRRRGCCIRSGRSSRRDYIRRERKWAVPFVLCTAGLFIIGGLFAYFVAFRYGLAFLLGLGGDAAA